MNLTTTQIYWMTRLPLLSDFFAFMAGTGGILVAVSIIMFIISSTLDDNEDHDLDKLRHAARKILLIGIAVILVAMPVAFFLPTRPDLLAMYGIPALRESGILTADQIRVLDMLASGMK